MTMRTLAIAEIAHVGGRYDVEGHSRSLMLVPAERPHATSYQLIILTYILSYIIFQLSHSSRQIIAFDKGCLSLVQLFLVISTNIGI